MTYKDKTLCKIRTITTFISLDKNKATWKDEIKQASQFCLNLTSKFSVKGYTVQSIRIVTNPFGEYLNTQNLESARTDLSYLSALLTESSDLGMRVRFAIGEARSKEEIELLPELIKEFGDLCNVCVNVKLDEHGVLDNSLIEHCVKAI